MAALKNIIKVPFEIASLLATDPTIRSLLYIDQPNALTQHISFNDGVSAAQHMINENYIHLFPFVETGIKDFTRNTFLQISLEGISFSREHTTVSANGTILITTDNTHIMLDNNKNRLLELADLIDQRLHGVKLSSSIELKINYISAVPVSNFRSGYSIHFSISDQLNAKAEL